MVYAYEWYPLKGTRQSQKSPAPLDCFTTFYATYLVVKLQIIITPKIYEWFPLKKGASLNKAVPSSP